MSQSDSAGQQQQLRRVVGLAGAVPLGLGSILGTGVFVSLLFVVQIAEEWAVVSVAIAAALAVCNGLSSAQLAASHPVSGGAYEYGYRFLTPTLGFNAGWMFLVAKGASAATAALVLSECIREVVPRAEQIDVRVIAVVTIAAVSLLVISGVRRSVRVNAAIVGAVLLSLCVFVVSVLSTAPLQLTFAQSDVSMSDILQASALCFVAYTGYGRVATMGEEISDPARNIPRAVIITLITTFMVYVFVAIAVIAGSSMPSGSEALSDAKSIAGIMSTVHASDSAVTCVRAGTMLAMLGVLLNLVLGLSRVVLAMARRSDLPSWLAVLGTDSALPQRAVILVAGLVSLLTMTGSVFSTWSMSAFTVLVYYATANLCALRQPPEERRYSRLVSAAGLFGCLSLAPFIDRETILSGLSLILVGLVVKQIADYQNRKRFVN